MARASAKSPEAFRTISEAADALDLPQHVLRFWETRFSQIKPMKRSGGRRYYRPGDIALLQGIRHLLYDEGYTIKGVQRILREQGIAHVVSFAEQKPAAPAPQPAAPPLVQPRPEPVPQQPIVQQPDQPDPVRAALASPQPQQPMPPQVAQQAPVAPPPVAASSGLRFVAEPEPEPQPQPQPQAPSHPLPQPALSQAVPQPVSQPQQPIASQPLPNPVAPAVTPVLDTVTPAPSVAQPTLPPGASDVGGQLAPHQTESLVRALRTLMECKSQLDQARPAPTASSSSSPAVEP
ncbi:MAG: MerR family transcriptional regulator [Pseudomonadota bacterium]